VTDGPSNAELGGRIADLRTDIASLRAHLSQDYVLAQVHKIVIDGLTDRVRRLEEEQAAAKVREENERSANRRTRWQVVAGGIAAFLASLGVAVISAFIRG
jgi:hypothetical protein